jgi:D-arabinose 1-dehydrogenase-like Zn-dependent alcohol dehydrogenase
MLSPNVREFGKCLVFYGYDKLANAPKLSMEEFVLPNRNSELAKGQVLLKMSLATVCGSDLHTLRGRRKEPVPW